MENTIPSAVQGTATRIAIPARDHGFVAAERFVAGANIGSFKLRIVNQAYMTALLPRVSFEPYGSYGLAHIEIDREMLDSDVVRMLGSRTAAETSVVSQCDVLEHYPEELAPFRGDEYSVFFVRGVDGDLYTAKVKISGGTCDLLAFPFGEKILGVGCRVFFPY
jgi:hypothetical protein